MSTPRKENLMDRTEYEVSRMKTYDVIKKARSEIERIQFVEGLHNDLTESVKQTLIDIENRLLNDRVLKPERPSTNEMLKKYQEQIAGSDGRRNHDKDKRKTRNKSSVIGEDR